MTRGSLVLYVRQKAERLSNGRYSAAESGDTFCRQALSGKTTRCKRFRQVADLQQGTDRVETYDSHSEALTWPRPTGRGIIFDCLFHQERRRHSSSSYLAEY
jgi:hypothetical protein